MVPALWQVQRSGVLVHSRLQYPKSRLTSPGFCSGRAVLAFVRSVVPYILALSSKRSRPMMSPAPCRPVVTPKYLKQADSSSSESSALLIKLEVVPKEKHNYQSPIDALFSSRNHRLIINLHKCNEQGPLRRVPPLVGFN